jgi:hypothetical protein
MSIVGHGLGRDTDVVGGYAAYGMGIVSLQSVVILTNQNVYLIAEELRFLPIFRQQRLCAVSGNIRTETVEFESRVVIVPQKRNF